MYHDLNKVQTEAYPWENWENLNTGEMGNGIKEYGQILKHDSNTVVMVYFLKQLSFNDYTDIFMNEMIHWVNRRRESNKTSLVMNW